MIESILLEDFQKHEEKELELDEFLTVFVGRSDAGKSAVIRAFSWVCTNEPRGDSFVRRGRKGCNVSVGVDGRKVCRKRNKSENLYLLDGKEYAALKPGHVPEEVSSLLNVGDVNFQRQHDGPFWFGLTGGQVSRELNRIVDLSQMDRALSEASSRVKESRSRVALCQERLEASRKATEGMEWLVVADVSLKALEALEGEMRALEEEKVELAGMVTEVRQRGELVESCARKLEGLGSLLRRAEELDDLRERRDDLRQALQELEKGGDRVTSLVARLHEVQEELASVENCPLCGAPTCS